MSRCTIKEVRYRGSRQSNNVASYGYGLLMLGIESRQVIALRLARLSRGGKRAQRENARMPAGKVGAGMTTGMRVLRGVSRARILKGCRSKVRANMKRRSRTK